MRPAVAAHTHPQAHPSPPGAGAPAPDQLKLLRAKCEAQPGCRHVQRLDAAGRTSHSCVATELVKRGPVGQDILKRIAADVAKSAAAEAELGAATERQRELEAALAARDGDRYLAQEESEWLAPVRKFAIDAMMVMIREDLAGLGIEMDVFSSERALVEGGAVQATIDKLQQDGHLYRGVLDPPKGREPEDWEPREQLLFRTTNFGDDMDRPLQKSDGGWTYFSSDIAYHLDKLERTSGTLINIFGVDHGGYVKRMTAAVAALSGMQNMLDIK